MSAQGARYLRRRIVVGCVLAAVVGAAVAAIANTGRSPSRAHTARSTTTRAIASTAQPGFLAAGSDPAVLPGPLLIADEGNDRLVEISPTGTVLWEFPRPGDLAAGQTFKVPDDAFFTPDGKQIVATEEDDFVVSVIDIATRRIVWRYGTPGTSGSDANQLANPDDALMLNDGSLLSADIKNCRIVRLRKGSTTPVQVWGKPYHCEHLAVPLRFGSPNGAFPLRDGHFLVTEITHNWVSEINLFANPPTVLWDVHPPNVHYPSDTNEVRPGVFVTVDYWHPGVIEEFDKTGKVLWFYKPLGAKRLYKPSLAEALPNGDIIATDDYNHRVIVVDPKTDKVVWQYGHLGKPGTRPGYLDTPDGLDLAPPYSLASRYTH
ncbi:MAG TPA: PQQ-binding-like beta-propeller repeat protein [Acidimicrobiia bacterium]